MKRATVLLGFLPVDGFEDVANDDERQRMKADLVHRAMETMFAPLVAALKTGVEMWCVDGRLRHVFLLVTTYMADWPKQNLQSCTTEGSCPVCTTKRKGRGELSDEPVPLQDWEETLRAIQAYFDFRRKRDLQTMGLKPVWPWWASLDHINLATCLTPNLLHQLYQGIFKSHLMRWLQYLVGVKELDTCFTSTTQAAGMRHFGKGVSHVQQWTGQESKEMLKQVAPLVAGTLKPPELSQLVLSAIDFIYRAHSSSMTNSKIDELDTVLETFHRLKVLMVEQGFYGSSAWFDRIPKLQMLMHYSHAIHELSTPDGYNTDALEHLHIEYAKEPWQASNKEAIRIHCTYMNKWLKAMTGWEPEPQCSFRRDGLSHEGLLDEVTKCHEIRKMVKWLSTFKPRDPWRETTYAKVKWDKAKTSWGCQACSLLSIYCVSTVNCHSKASQQSESHVQTGPGAPGRKKQERKVGGCTTACNSQLSQDEVEGEIVEEEVEGELVGVTEVVSITSDRYGTVIHVGGVVDSTDIAQPAEEDVGSVAGSTGSTGSTGSAESDLGIVGGGPGLLPSDATYYPNPQLSMAKAPTKPNLRLKDVTRDYGATDLISATTDFLVNRAEIPHPDTLLCDYSRINIGHRLHLHHDCLPFAPLKPLRHDVVHASPTTLDAAGHVRTAGVWDTVLFKERPNRPAHARDAPEKHGIRRYRPGQVHAFFSLPAHIRHYYPGQLAYLELFSAINAGVSSFHGVNSTRVELTPSGRHRTLVVPVTDIVLACHLSPKFHMLDREVKLNSQTDLFTISKHFWINHFYSHHMYNVVQHWRKQPAPLVLRARLHLLIGRPPSS
ncbi:hypothetical protein FRC10_001590 [Ceratobasidium sp. 414]|nr:hypothetical protein FRC10_001590 [Ceratobasidium sp. 414]